MDLSTLPASGKEVVGTDVYRRITSPFLRWAALSVGMPEESEALLHAAWEEEDAGRDATALRRRAAASWPAPADVEAALRLVDIQRRAGLFAEATATLDRFATGQDDGALRIAAFERARIAAADTGRHLLSSALRPPARTPHVTHGKPATGGFWSRLLRTTDGR